MSIVIALAIAALIVGVIGQVKAGPDINWAAIGVILLATIVLIGAV